MAVALVQENNCGKVIKSNKDRRNCLERKTSGDTTCHECPKTAVEAQAAR
jgi:hypothetical protein